MNYRVSLWEFLGNNQVTKIAVKRLILPNQAEINNSSKARNIGFVSLYLGWDKF